jgi:ATP-dependent DNA ligase
MFYLAQLVEKRRTLYSLIRAEALAHLILGPQIEFTEWTADGHLRTSSFAGSRIDKQAREIRREYITLPRF